MSFLYLPYCSSALAFSAPSHPLSLYYPQCSISWLFILSFHAPLNADEVLHSHIQWPGSHTSSCLYVQRERERILSTFLSLFHFSPLLFQQLICLTVHSFNLINKTLRRQTPLSHTQPVMIHSSTLKTYNLTDFFPLLLENVKIKINLLLAKM